MRRHDRVTLRPGAEITVSWGQGDISLADEARRWVDAGRPLVYARQPGAGERIHLGLALPLRCGRLKLSCVVAPDAIGSVEPPLPLAVAASRLPDALASPLAELAHAVTSLGGQIGLYGSLAWELASNEAYRLPDSDVDIVCDVATRAQFDATMAALKSAADRLPCRLDGEVRFPGDLAVSWRELDASSQSGGFVLTKGEVGVSLAPIPFLLNTLAHEGPNA